MKENEPQKFQAKEAAAQAQIHLHRHRYRCDCIGGALHAQTRRQKLHEFAKLATAAESRSKSSRITGSHGSRDTY